MGFGKLFRLRSMPSAAVAAAVFGVLWAGAAVAQGLPESISIPVTFYDFRSDRSNPEFEQPHGRPAGCTDNSSAASGACIRAGMVANTLDADNKPAVGPTPYRNYGIAHWFRDWNTYTAGPYSKGKNRAPVYDPKPGIRQEYNNEWGANVVYIGDEDVGHDTSFKNIVIKDSLRFMLQSVANGTYRFDRRGNNGFFPLDNKGFGNEWVVVDNARGNHNFAFTMEMAFPFTAKEGMSFSFSGDDDVWVFIDKQLVLDLGGIHSEQSKSFNISDVPGVVYGRGYTLRIFYTERHSSASNILIQTNIVAPPAGIGISTQDNTGKGGMVGGNVDKSADEPLTLYSVIRDDAGYVLTPNADYDCNLVVWSVGGKEIGKGCEITVRDSVARSVDITVIYKPAAGGAPVTGSTNLNVRALPPVSIHIQRSPEPKDPTGKGGLSDDIYFNFEEYEVKVYAVLRDKYGNFVGYAERQGTVGSLYNWWSTEDARWVSVNMDVATVSPEKSAKPTVRKGFMGEGTSDYLAVTYSACTQRDGCVTLSDTVRVGSAAQRPNVVSGRYISEGGVIKSMELTFDHYIRGAPSYEIVGMELDLSLGAFAASLPGGRCVSYGGDGVSLSLDFGCVFPGRGVPASMGANSIIRIYFAYDAGAPLIVRFNKGAISVLESGRVLPPSGPAGETAVIAPAAALSVEFAVGPNPTGGSSGGMVNFFRGGSRVVSASLAVYDASGNAVRKISVRDAGGGDGRRRIGSWDLTDGKGRRVSEGAYLVKGVLRLSDGKRESVAAVVGVR